MSLCTGTLLALAPGAGRGAKGCERRICRQGAGREWMSGTGCVYYGCRLWVLGAGCELWVLCVSHAAPRASQAQVVLHWEVLNPSPHPSSSPAPMDAAAMAGWCHWGTMPQCTPTAHPTSQVPAQHVSPVTGCTLHLLPMGQCQGTVGPPRGHAGCKGPIHITPTTFIGSMIRAETLGTPQHPQPLPWHRGSRSPHPAPCPSPGAWLQHHLGLSKSSATSSMA